MKDDQQEKRIIHDLKKDWHQLEQLSDHHFPSRFEVGQQVALFVKEKKKQLIRELLLFVITALILLSITLFTLFQSVLLFIMIQVFAVLMGPIIWLVLFKKDKQREERLS
ncbi:YxlC family protein [Alkalihalobacillus sp. 1P02AB]|uniref:YxlC family protein n=1 Tax=Alkalihalobacillus sp. 1P02AB TaxID=3132260 RepID=UPI0039A4C068